MGVDSDHSYMILDVSGGKVKVIERPDQKQKENALLNYLLEDNYLNPCKQGIYSLTADELKMAYNEYFKRAAIEGTSTFDFFEIFALNPKETGGMKSAVNGLVADVLRGVSHNNEIDYVSRYGTVKHPNSILDMLKVTPDNKLCIAHEGNGYNGYSLYKYSVENSHMGNGELKAYPNRHEKENALLNLLLLDNESNLSKTGIYHRDAKQIEGEYNARVLSNVGCHRIDVDYVLDRFGLHYEDESRQRMVCSLAEDVIDDILHLEKGDIDMSM